MIVTTHNDRLIEISVELVAGQGETPVARVEAGPLLKSAVAAPALFESGELASHYGIGKADRNGALIVDGQEFTYLDWKRAHVWHVYEYATEAWTGPNTPVLDEHGEPLRTPEGGVVLALGPAWRRRGHYATQAEAMAAATVIAQTRAV